MTTAWLACCLLSACHREKLAFRFRSGQPLSTSVSPLQHQVVPQKASAAPVAPAASTAAHGTAAQAPRRAQARPTNLGRGQIRQRLFFAECRPRGQAAQKLRGLQRLNLLRRAAAEHASVQDNRLLRSIGLSFLVVGAALVLLILLTAGSGSSLFLVLVGGIFGYAFIGAGLVLLLVSLLS